MKPGGSTFAKIGVVPLKGSGSTDPDRAYQVFVVGFSTSSQLSIGNKKTWDTGGEFQGPLPMTQDGALASAAVNSDACELAGQHLSDISDVTWKAVRTDKLIDDQDKARQIANSKIKIHAAKSASQRQEQIYFVVGVWNDQNDNHTPDDGEVGCTGGTITSLTITS